MARRTRICLLSLLALFALPVAHAAAADIYSSVSPSVLRGPGPWAVTYQLEFDAGATDEHVSLRLQGIGFVAPSPTVDGPGTVTSSGEFLLSSLSPCGLGFADSGIDGGATYDLDLPAGTRTILGLPIVVSHPFALGQDRLDDLLVTIGDQPYQLPSPALAVPKMVPIQVTLPSKLIPSGRRITIGGRTSPLIAGRAVDLRAAFATRRYVTKPETTIRLARLRVGADGSFSYRWRPPAPGFWTVTASYDSHDPRFLDSDSACGPPLQVGSITTLPR